MPIGTVDTILFAIRAGLRLAGAIRKAYIDGTRARPLVLPMPRTKGVNIVSVKNWFTNDKKGSKIREEHPRIELLLGLSKRTSQQDLELKQLYLAYYFEANPRTEKALKRKDHNTLSGEELGALFEIRQWGEDENVGPSAFQRIAGTLVEIAVDYFNETPGAISESRPLGRALKAFLVAMDEVEFSEDTPTEFMGEILVAVLDGVAANSDLFTGEEKEREFVKNITKSLAESAKEHLSGQSTEDRWEGSRWLQIIARSIVKGGAETVLAHPEKFIKAEDDELNLITQVGSTFADLLIGPKKVTFQRLLSAEGASALMMSALDALAKNPSLLRVDNEGLKNMLLAVAEEIAKPNTVLSGDVFPELARLILEKSADNLELLWGEESSDSQKHLLVTATRSVLTALSENPATGDEWKPRFTSDQILSVLEDVFQEVVDNPEWVVKEAQEESDLLGLAVAAIMKSLSSLDGKLISAEAGLAILKAGVGAVAESSTLLAKLPENGTSAAGEVALSLALEAIFSTVFAHSVAAEAKWRMARNSFLQVLVEIALSKLAKVGAEKKHIDALRAFVEDLMDKGEVPEPDALARDLEQALKAA